MQCSPRQRMKYKCADENRDLGIRYLFDAILKKNLREKHSYRESKEAAFYAVSLRYTLSKKRIKAIVNQQARADLQATRVQMRFENETLLENLETENEYLRRKLEENEKLMEVMNYVQDRH